MSDFGSSAVRQLRQQRLAGELRRLRRRAHLTGNDVATRLGWSEAKLSRIENGLARVKRQDLDAFMDLYDVAEPRRSELIALAEESRGADPLEELERDLPTGHARIVAAEWEAETIWTWEPQVVPGLLQTEDYTRAVLQPWPAIFASPPAETERRVETRLLRQHVLTRDPPVEASFVIDESVLIRAFASQRVMHDQLVHLVELSEQPNIELRIVALAGRQVIATGSFVYFRYKEIHGVPLSSAVALEHLERTTFIESEQDVNTYQVMFNELRATSLDPQASREMIARVARDRWR